MGEKNQIDLKKSVDDLNEVINKEEQKEEEKTVSMLAKAMEKLGLRNGQTEINITKSKADSITEEVEDESDDVEAPQMSDVESGEIDASEFVEKAIGYMSSVHDLVKSLKSEIELIKETNTDLTKSMTDAHFALSALLNSQTELHKATKTKVEPITATTREVAIPSKAQLNKSVDNSEDDETTLTKNNKDYFDNAEVNILAKALRESTITAEEYSEAKRTYTIPKRLLS